MRFLPTLATMAGVVCATALPASASTEWIMATGLPDSSFLTKNVRMFVEEVEKASNGELKIQLHTNSTLIKRAAIKRAVQSGQVQLGELDFQAYGNEDPMYVLNGTPGLVPTVEASKRLWELQLPYLEGLFAKNGMKILYPAFWPPLGFYTQEPVKTAEDFKGKKLRIYSTATQRMGDLLGFQALILPFAEVPQAFSTGLINSMYTSAQTGVDTQAWDHTNHFYVVGGRGVALCAVNAKAFEALNPDLQKAMMEAADRAYTRGFELLEEATASQSAKLIKHGMTVGPLPDPAFQAYRSVGQIMLEDWRKAASPEAGAILDAFLKEQKY